MDKASNAHELEVTQDLAHERREWRIERTSQMIFALVLGAALLGLFGSGPLAYAHAGETDAPLQIDYERFERKLSPAIVEVTFSPDALEQSDTGPVLRLAIGADYARAINITSSTPAPDHQEVGDDAIVYVYNISSLRRDARIQLRINPDTVGVVRGHIGVKGELPLLFNQFVYP